MDAEQWHEHYRLQGQWLAEGRDFLLRRAGIANFTAILDFGCATGVISEEIRRRTGRPLTGIDRDMSLIELARKKFPANHFLHGDETTLLKARLRFDLILISFVLMWQPDPIPFLSRMRRLLAKKGRLLVLAEPDYGGRIDYPEELTNLKDIYIDHIQAGNGDPFIGRKLAFLLDEAGFQAETGVFNQVGQFPFPGQRRWEKEWRFWERLTGRDLGYWRKIERRAIAAKKRFVLFPIFHADAWVRGPWGR